MYMRNGLQDGVAAASCSPATSCSSPDQLREVDHRRRSPTTSARPPTSPSARRPTTTSPSRRTRSAPAARNGAKDSCYGDSGGPLVAALADDKGYVQVGIVSWGMQCGNPALPGVYSRIAQFNEWIDRTDGGELSFRRFPRLQSRRPVSFEAGRFLFRGSRRRRAPCCRQRTAHRRRGRRAAGPRPPAPPPSGRWGSAPRGPPLQGAPRRRRPWWRSGSPAGSRSGRRRPTGATVAVSLGCAARIEHRPEIGDDADRRRRLAAEAGERGENLERRP